MTQLEMSGLVEAIETKVNADAGWTDTDSAAVNSDVSLSADSPTPVEVEDEGVRLKKVICVCYISLTAVHPSFSIKIEYLRSIN